MNPSRFCYSAAENVLPTLLQGVNEQRRGLGHGSTFILTEDDIEVLFQVGKI